MQKRKQFGHNNNSSEEFASNIESLDMNKTKNLGNYLVFKSIRDFLSLSISTAVSRLDVAASEL